MKRDHTRILKQLSIQAYNNVSRGILLVMVMGPEADFYNDLVKLRFVKVRNTIFGRAYMITRRGWDALTKRVKQEIITDYNCWVKFTNPTIAGPSWLKWLK